ncbi:type II toxin-antitoxin system antitoxin DNA ADP-ribosyl glycohydrolase DarG [Actinoplanes siamensis]|uniref:Appr-1-p processing protein n=1 Tax=Actinoplanes siamensis TaxID=1223317 RepID=A0A919TL78_9ACTN|nr:macro domain-containing protein [Actinoplanes siamensis]GIF05875.1 Appr-1-p processing protein [Actinoplanes siamensis]
MIEVGHGNLLTSEVEALVNTVNTVGVMGKGIALQFKRAFPANFRAYRAACARGEIQLGQVWLFDTGVLGPRRYILNFPTKQHWRNASQLSDIAAGLDSLVSLVHEHRIRSLAIPALGCGNGGLDWAEVRPLIEQACSRMPDVRALVFAPEGAPAAASMPNATPRPNLTANRALLLASIARYLSRAATHEAREGVSELEIQKLAYLLQVLGAPLRLEFVRGTYGPYSVGLNGALDTLEGHYLSGIGDRSAAVTDLAPVNLTPGSAEAAEAELSGHPAQLQALESLLSLVDGFETPYSLELLATVHFAATQGSVTSDTEILAQRVSRWSIRKARMFTDRHIRVAARHLARNGLLPPAPAPVLATSR